MSLQPEGGVQDEDIYASAEADEIAMPPAAAKKKKRKAPPAEPVEVGSLWISIGESKRFTYCIWFTVLLSMLLMCVDSPHTGPAFSTAYNSDGFRYVLDHEVYTADGTRYGYREYPGSDARGSSAWVSTEADWLSGSGPGLWRPDLLNSLELLCTVVYSFEAMVLVLSKGWRGYFGSGRNVVQFIVFLAGWIKVLIYFGGGKATGGAISILGGLRALRPWLVLSLNPQMNDIFLCLIRAIKALTSIVSIMVFFFVIFGLIGMQLFPSVLKNRCIAAGPDESGPWPVLCPCKRLRPAAV
tara:strand:- start:1442 stop:2335 length:894 start_codon:yes stop_codon:yes gene_type:complete